MHHILLRAESIKFTSQLCLQRSRGSQVEVLCPAHVQPDLLGQLDHEGVDEVGVLDDDGDLGEERLVADVEVLDGVRAEVSLLEHLDRLGGEAIGL